MTKTPFLVLFVILISVGITSAYAINITLGGTVDITEILNMMGNKITNLGTPAADTDAATKEYVDQASSADTLPPIWIESPTTTCPPNMSQAGPWCIDNTVRSSAEIDAAMIDCLDEGKVITPFKTLWACDNQNLATSDCGEKTDNSSASLWTSDVVYEETVSGNVFDRMMVFNGNNTFTEVNAGPGISFEYFCSQPQLILQHDLHQHSTINSDPVIVAVGDIACEEESPQRTKSIAEPNDYCHEKETSDIALAVNPDAVFLLGDLQYRYAEEHDFDEVFDPSWGRLKTITYPSAGNHDYYNPGAQAYFDYFGAAAGDPAKGWYSFDIGSWHIISLNSNCPKEDPDPPAHFPQKQSVDACTDPTGDGEQIQWLENDLARNDSKCTLAFWHHPLFSSAENNGGSDDRVEPFWDKLYAAKADVVLVGHQHDYERFNPQNSTAKADADGITQFVVGTGGWNLIDSDETYVANSAVFEDQSFGVLKLVLHESSYDWEFIGEPGSTFTDQGTGVCN